MTETKTLESKAHVPSYGTLLRELRNSDEDENVNVDDFGQLKDYLASSASKIRVTRPNLPLDTFVGLKEIKKHILGFLEEGETASSDSDYFMDNDPVLLFGEIGTGKTHLVRAIATELKANLIEFEVHSVSQWLAHLDSYTKAFVQLCQEKKGPKTVLFLDDVDLFCTRDEEKRSTLRFIKEIQSAWAKSAEGTASRLIIFAATNKPTSLDEKIVLAFHTVYVPTLNLQERKQLFQRMIQKNWKLGHVMIPKEMDWLGRTSYGILTSEIEVFVDKAIRVQYPKWSNEPSLGEELPNGALNGGGAWRALEVNDFIEVLRGFLVLNSKTFFEFETFQRKYTDVCGPFMRMYEREDFGEENRKGKKKRGWGWSVLEWF